MADGPIIQEANKLALSSNLSTQQSLNLIKELSKSKNNTSFVIMCYLNTVRKFGVDKFIKSIRNIVDGIIIVDLPFEEESEIKKSLSKNNIHLIKLISPMTDKKRAQKLLKGSKGFIYYISATGITGFAVKPSSFFISVKKAAEAAFILIKSYLTNAQKT